MDDTDNVADLTRYRETGGEDHRLDNTRRRFLECLPRLKQGTFEHSIAKAFGYFTND